jgi:hypothetical protein
MFETGLGEALKTAGFELPKTCNLIVAEVLERKRPVSEYVAEIACVPGVNVGTDSDALPLASSPVDPSNEEPS